MASLTQTTRYRRKLRRKNAGKERKRALRLHGTTPAFPIHTPEADANAPAEVKQGKFYRRKLRRKLRERGEA
ncbi:MAG: hypothetical protein VX278_19315 [Myxococcota bacterium]|nr:hypothetical protein [Myxococcota bacterium]